MTGAELHERLRRGAAERGVSLRKFAEALSPRHPTTWLDQLSRATQPRARTVERVEALLRGDAPSALPPKTLRKKSQNRRVVVEYPSSAPVPEKQRVDRDPCPHCATRRDFHAQFGCGRDW